MIDIILPCYKCRETIADTIQSIRNQSYTDWNLIIIIDEYSLNLYELVHQLCEDVISKKIIMLDGNYGVAHARNIGLSHSSSRYIAFIDADDIWHPNKLEYQYNIMEDNLEISICGTNYFRFQQKKSFEKLSYVTLSTVEITAKELMYYNPFCFSSLLLRAEDVNKVTFNDVGHEDYDYIINIWKTKPDLKLISIVGELTHYRISDDSVSGTIFTSTKKSINLRKVHFGIMRAYFGFPLYVFKVFRKRYCR